MSEKLFKKIAKEYLKNAIEFAKDNYHECAKAELHKLEGALYYAHMKDDISQATWDTYHHIKYLIMVKYNLY